MAINNWWDDNPEEIYWMEIRHEREGLGEYLRAPRSAANGKSSWSYELTTFVQPGDRVFHWHDAVAGEPGIVGWSTASGPLESVEWSWQARGTRGRTRGVPTVGPAWHMPLTGFTELPTPILRSDLNARRGEIMAVIDGLHRVAEGPLYAPFQHYGQRELRAQQGYLTKFPAELVYLLTDSAVTPRENDGAQGARNPSVRRDRGQGYLADAAKRRALERHAVDTAIEHYRRAGASLIEERGRPYDLRVILDGVERHVEVKGSVGLGLDSVQLTQGEVDHALTFQPTDLFVVDGIIAAQDPGGAVSTTGGETRIWREWVPDGRSLRPTHLRYRLPPS